MEVNETPYAIRALNHFLAKVEEANSNPEVKPWDEAIKQGLCWRNNLKYGLKEPLQVIPLWDILNEYYQDALRSIRGLEWDEEKEDQQLIDLRATIANLPENLPRTKEEVRTTEDYEPLLISLWGYIESEDEDSIETFDLGDDGTDEMEQDLTLVCRLLQAYQAAAKCDNRSLFQAPIYSIERWVIISELLNEDEYPWFQSFSVNHTYNILKYYADRVETMEWATDAQEWLTEWLLKEYDIPMK